MNIKAYLARVNFDGIAQADIATLTALQYAHMLSVPFENLDIHLGRKITLDEVHLFDKIVEKRRGGFCYELNTLFGKLLSEIGFQVSLVAAEVFNDQGKAGPPFDHMALLVSLDGEQYLVDVGFGNSFTVPLPLSERGEQASKNMQGSYKICLDANSSLYTVMKAAVPGMSDQRPMFRFLTTSRQVAEFDEMCVYHQTSEHSHFTRKELCSRATSSGRVTISGNSLIETDGESRVVTELQSPEDKRRALMEHFGIRL